MYLGSFIYMLCVPGLPPHTKRCKGPPFHRRGQRNKFLTSNMFLTWDYGGKKQQHLFNPSFLVFTRCTVGVCLLSACGCPTSQVLPRSGSIFFLLAFHTSSQIPSFSLNYSNVLVCFVRCTGVSWCVLWAVQYTPGVLVYLVVYRYYQVSIYV